MRKTLLIFIILFSVFLAAGCAENAVESTEGAVEEGAPMLEDGITEEETPVDDVDPVYQNFPSDVDTEEEIPVEETTEVEAGTDVEAVTPDEAITSDEEAVEVIPIVKEEPEEGAISAGEVAEDETTKDELTEEDYLEKYLQEYEQEGKIEFNTPEKMKVGESEIFSAYITRNISENISKVIGSDEKLQSRNITVTPKMKVTLKGGGEGNFKIDPLTDDVQPIIRQRTTTWKWSVTPQKSGKQALILNVYLVISSDSGETIRYIDELENEIEVEVNPSYFFENNWQWLIGTAVTILLALLGMYAKSKSK